MAQYYIHEANLERLEKKLATIQRKCLESNCSFGYEITGTDYRECVDENGVHYTAKYYIVEVEGEAKYNGWTFVATIDHHEEGNVIRAYKTDVEIPDRYKNCSPTCEHCKKIRSRKDTYLIYNEENQEFKQVGKACLQEYTNGLSAENVAFFCSIYEKVASAGYYSGTSYNKYIEAEPILNYAFECYKHWGYQKSRNSFYDEYLPENYRSTKERVVDYYYINRAGANQRKSFYAEMDEVSFNPHSEYATSSTKAALEWIRNENPDNEYIRNLKVICSEQYVEYRDLGILVSLPTAYDRHLGKVREYEEKQKAASVEANSGWVGSIKDKITVNCKSFECKSCFNNYYGTTWMYKFTDENNNVYIWYASNPVESEDRVATITGTVKDHSEFNGVKQTVLTRCKVNYRPEAEVEHAPYNNDAEEAIEDFLEYCNA